MTLSYDRLYSIVILHWIHLAMHLVLSVTVYPDITSFLNDKIHLPCNITSPSPDDNITLILWYKSDMKNSPIYTVDNRHIVVNPHHHPNELFGERANFNLSVQPALLSIEPVQEDDEGEYRCRVDFRWGRTLTSIIKLKVIVPPKKLMVKNENDEQISGLIGPIEEGSKLKLKCLAKGGKPLPTLYWYRDNNILNDFKSFVHDNSIVENELILKNVKRTDHNVNFTCQAFNNHSSSLLSVSITLDIYVKPSEVQIISIKRPLSAGKKFDLICRSSGSRPPAQITWYKNNILLTKTRETFSIDGNTTTSVFEFIPTAQDNGVYLVCRAENLRLANSSIQDQWKLNIFYAPQVTLSLQTKLKNDIVIRGGHVILDCQIKANPFVVDVNWLFNDKPIVQNENKDLVIQNTTLEIRNVQLSDEGKYQCTSTNLEGKGKSNQLKLDVFYAPVCKANQTNITIGVAFGEMIKLQCDVDASPNQVTFYWTSNNSTKNHLKFINKGLTSILTFEKITKDHIGNVSCSARNIVGNQKEPCIFQIIAAGPPEAVRECIIRNQTVSSFLVDCIPGYDGGLEQAFHLIVNDVVGKKLLSNVTEREKPEFFVNGLRAGSSFQINIYSSNAKGNSKSVLLTGTTLPLSSSSAFDASQTFEFIFELNPLIGIITGLITAVILVTTIIILICKINRRNTFDDNTHKTRRRFNRRKSEDKHCEFNLYDEKSPDIIPPSVNIKDYSKLNYELNVNTNWNTPFENVKSVCSNGNLKNFNQRKKVCLISNEIDRISENIISENIISENINSLCSSRQTSNESPIHGRFSNCNYSTLGRTCLCHKYTPVINLANTQSNIKKDSQTLPFRALSTPV